MLPTARSVFRRLGPATVRFVSAILRRTIDVVGRPLDELVLRRARTRSVVVLIYHRVGARSPSPVDIATETFAAHLDLLADHGCVVDLDSAVRLLTDSHADPESNERSIASRPPVVLTFDDGTADWVDEVLPQLAARQLPATFYVSTDFVERSQPFPDGGDPIGWSGLAELASSGLATIGSHTHTHRVLSHATAADAAGEVDRSVGLIQDRLGIGCEHFAYPKAIAPSTAADVVVRRRFASAALAGNRTNAPGRIDLHRLGRHGLTVADDLDAFAHKVRGGAWLEGRLRQTRDEIGARRANS